MSPQSFRKALRHARKAERGAAMVEYAVLLAVLALVVMLAVTALGTNVRAVYDKVARAVGIPSSGGSGDSSGDGDTGDANNGDDGNPANPANPGRPGKPGRPGNPGNPGCMNPPC